MINHLITLSLSQFCGCIKLPTKNDSRWNDYCKRESKIKMKLSFLRSQNNLYEYK